MSLRRYTRFRCLKSFNYKLFRHLIFSEVHPQLSIFERNADRLVNANTIYEGQVIVLPAK